MRLLCVDDFESWLELSGSSYKIFDGPFQAAPCLHLSQEGMVRLRRQLLDLSSSRTVELL